jgi:hypothetical protein
MTEDSGCNTISSVERDEVLVVRVPGAVKAALREAAEDDHGRTMSGMVVRILREWLLDRSYLPQANAPKREKKG